MPVFMFIEFCKKHRQTITQNIRLRKLLNLFYNQFISSYKTIIYNFFVVFYLFLKKNLRLFTKKS